MRRPCGERVNWRSWRLVFVGESGRRSAVLLWGLEMGWDILPAADLITQPYGCTAFPEWRVDKSVCETGLFHAGVDLGSTQGGWAIFQRPVYATRAGIVVAIGLPYLGPYAVVVQAGAVFIEHGHLDQASVQVGDAVGPGQQIGLVGTQGNSTAPHLHVEVRTDGPHQGNPDRFTVDSMPYLDYLTPPPEEDDMPVQTWILPPTYLTPQSARVYIPDINCNLDDLFVSVAGADQGSGSVTIDFTNGQAPAGPVLQESVLKFTQSDDAVASLTKGVTRVVIQPPTAPCWVAAKVQKKGA